MFGFSIDDGDKRMHGLTDLEDPVDFDANGPTKRIKETTRPETKPAYDTLIDTLIESTRRSRLLESQTSLMTGPIGKMLRDQEETIHQYRTYEFDCPKFQSDLRTVSLLSSFG